MNTIKRLLTPPSPIRDPWPWAFAVTFYMLLGLAYVWVPVLFAAAVCSVAVCAG